MLHAKTAVADGRWARVGSTNLNIASWLGNCEMDVAIEDDAFARAMEQMYIADLANSTELVLDEERRMHAPGAPKRQFPKAGRGRAGRAAAGMVRIGNTVGAAMTGHRALGPVESQLMVTVGSLLLALAIVIVVLPFLVVYPLAAITVWLGIVFLIRGFRLRR
jgi:cardiolipin synthase